MDGTISEIRCFAGNFPPRFWAFCNGQLLSISGNQALYSLIGTTYGGNGTTNFALPNLSASAPIGAGQGPGLSPRYLGQVGGAQGVVLTPAQLPPHNHPQVSPFAVGCSSGAGVSTLPQDGVPATTSGSKLYSTIADSGMEEQPANIQLQPAGGSMPHNNMPPFLGLNYIICVNGVYPSRD